ncbi:MAG: cytochrome c biogenesis protein CcsA [Bilophila sp.]
MYFLAFALLALSMLCALGGAAWAVRLLWTDLVPVQKKSKRGAAPAALRVTKNAESGLAFIEKMNLTLSACYILASAILVYALVTYDFSLVYVASYTDKLLPLFYRVTAFWAGQAGSMLFWAFSVALCGGVFQLTPAYKNLTPDTRLWYWTFYLSVMAFFGLILVTWNNPFLMTHTAPLDGNGLNPLLQNPGMIFHPPLLFLGYGGFVIPGCLALAQTMSQAQESEAVWTEVSRPFILSAWAFLTAGIVLGAWWAYMELGWGGYWAWDPVENASLIPWLIGTAALHTIIIQTRRNKLHGVNVFLMALTTLSAFFATYLVRSGVVQSVHAFGEGGVGVPLILFILLGTVIAAWVAFLAHNPKAKELAGLGSREGFLVLTSWLLIALSVVILVATMWPVFTAFWKETVMGLVAERTLDAAGHDHGGGAVGLTADFYNRVCMPLFALLIAFVSVCPWLGWNGGIRHKRNFFLVIVVFLVSAGALYAAGYRLPVALFGASASIAALVSILLLFTDKKVRGHTPSLAAYGIHLGLACMALGIAFSGPYKIEAEPTLAVGESTTVGAFQVTLKNLYEGEGLGYVFLEGELEIRKNGELLGIAAPQRRIFSKWGQMQFAEAAVIPSFGNEFYATLMAVDKENRAIFRLSSNPLVNWLWIGGTVMCLLPFVSFRRRSREKACAD